MYTHSGDAEMFEPAGATAAEQGTPPVTADADEDDRLSPAKGVVGAVLISIPFWMLVAFTIYLLM